MASREKTKDFPQMIKLGSIFSIRYGYVGGPVVSIARHLLEENLRQYGLVLNEQKGERHSRTGGGSDA